MRWRSGSPTARSARWAGRSSCCARADRDLGEQLDAEAHAIAESVADAEGQEGVAAFRERRTPEFG